MVGSVRPGIFADEMISPLLSKDGGMVATSVNSDEQEDGPSTNNDIGGLHTTATAADGTTTTTTHVSYRRHMIEVSKLTYPIILSEIGQNTLAVIDITFVGQLGKDELGAAALATVWFNIFNSSMIGFMTATDTLLAQTYGANQHDNFAVWTGNSLVIVFFATVFISGMVALCGPAMKLFGQDPELADAAGEFSFRLIPGLFPYYLFKVLTKYLQTQNILSPSIWIGVFANGVNVLFNWGLIYAADWGLAGAPWATTLTRSTEFVLIVIYMMIKKNSLNNTWPIISKKNLTRDVLKPFWKLAISGAMSFSAEGWSFEVITILAGLLSTVALEATIITLTIDGFFFLSFPFAVGIAASIRVGHLIGDHKPTDSKRSGHTSYFLACVMSAILIIIQWPCRYLLGELFCSDEEVSQLVSELIPISCIFMMGDAVQATTGGILRGIGRQKLVLWLNILGFWALALPIGAILVSTGSALLDFAGILAPCAYHLKMHLLLKTFPLGLGVYGLWWGMVIGIYLSSIIGIWYLRQVDWENEVTKAVNRLSTIASTRQILDPNTSLAGEVEEEDDSIHEGLESGTKPT